ncbi:MAG: hypothetical protein O7A06_14585 [Acidobacteria bacterium]|nr:hypothetical protein [Acidobacteriota bacterium]
MLLSRYGTRCRLRRYCVIAALGAVFFLAGFVSAADQKLVLQDGSDHLVRSYERKGERVRYFSTERQQWEEIPASLVDWEATEEARREMEKIPEVALEPEPAAPERFAVAPGVYLPEGEGVFVYGDGMLRSLVQSQATVRNDRKRSILGAIIPIPAIKGKSRVELEDSAAAISITASHPVFYLQIRQPSPAGFGLVRLEQKKDSRAVGEISVNPLTRNSSQSQNVAPTDLQEVQASSADGGPAVIRLSPREPLSEGEYAVVEFIESGELNLFVWDFSYHPSPEARLPRESQPKPVLQGGEAKQEVR